MIPDNTIIFKQFGVVRTFEKHEVRLHHHVQKDMEPPLKDGRHPFSICQEVGR
jgi:hypothetical protein